MISSRRCRYLVSMTAVFAVLSTGGAQASPQAADTVPQSTGTACPENDSGLKLPPGFCATIFADGIGHARDLVVAPDFVAHFAFHLATGAKVRWGTPR